MIARTVLQGEGLESDDEIIVKPAVLLQSTKDLRLHQKICVDLGTFKARAGRV